MDEPMVIIQRHHKAELNAHMMHHAISELSAILGPFAFSRDEKTEIFVWLTDEDADGDCELVAQLSACGVFLVDEMMPRDQRNRIGGACYFAGIPLFTEADLLEMITKELPPDETSTIN